MGKDYCAITNCHNTKGVIGRFGKPWIHTVPTLFLPQRTYSEINARETTNSTKNAFWYSGLGVEDDLFFYYL